MSKKELVNEMKRRAEEMVSSEQFHSRKDADGEYEAEFVNCTDIYQQLQEKYAFNPSLPNVMFAEIVQLLQFRMEEYNICSCERVSSQYTGKRYGFKIV